MAAAIVGLGLLAGCGQMGIPVGSAEAINQQVAQQSLRPGGPQVVLVGASGTVAPTDWEYVLKAAASVLSHGRPDQHVAWTNPQSGSTGTVSMTTDLPEPEDGACRAFSTTVNDLRGARSYRGEACQRNGEWVLTRVVPEDQGIT